jgi:hypothetical protein
VFGASLNYKHLLHVTPSLPTLTTQREAPHPCPSLPERRNGAAKRVDRRQLPYFKWGIKHIYTPVPIQSKLPGILANCHDGALS